MAKIILFSISNIRQAATNKLLIVALAFFGLSSDGNTKLSDEDREHIIEQMEKHATRKVSYWKNFINKPVDERVYMAPKELIEYINLDNQKNGYPNVPKLPVVSKVFVQDIKNAIKEMPNSIKRLLNSKLAGVFLIEDLGGTGYTDYIFDDNSNRVAAFVVLDAKVLEKRTANEWASWKERTPFKTSKEYTISAQIESPKNDTKKYAAQYILLHEFAHVVSVSEFIHPPWDVYPKYVTNLHKYSFFKESWRLNESKSKYSSIFDSDILPMREDIVYYFGPRLDEKQMVELYNKIERTNFPTLYATTRPSDDWAESFATYVHYVLMKKPFSIDIKSKEKVVKSFKLCWGANRCKQKERLLIDFLKKKK